MEEKNVQGINSLSEDLKVNPQEMNTLMKLGKNMFTLKNPDEMLKSANSAGLKKH